MKFLCGWVVWPDGIESSSQTCKQEATLFFEYNGVAMRGCKSCATYIGPSASLRPWVGAPRNITKEEYLAAFVIEE